jgi:hypothetical protein
MVRKVFWMDRRLSAAGARIYMTSHDLYAFKSGQPFAADFEVPVRFNLDEELRAGELPTFFARPAFVATPRMQADLRRLGIDNLQTYPAVIEDPADGRVIEDYALLNVIGSVACANMRRSQFATLGPDMNVIDEPVLDSQRVPDLDLFLLAEDTDKMLISERVYEYFKDQAYPDVLLQEVRQV